MKCIICGNHTKLAYCDKCGRERKAKAELKLERIERGTK